MSYTTTYSWTRSNAREVSSKVSADLAFMQRIYGKPTAASIANYEIELTELLAGGYLDNVTYGFKRGDDWVVALRYHARLDGTLSDEGAGRLLSIIGKDISGAAFYSYLIQNQTWHNLSDADREKILEGLPFRRGGAPEPGSGAGYWETDRSYASGSGGVSRSVLRTY